MRSVDACAQMTPDPKLYRSTYVRDFKQADMESRIYSPSYRSNHQDVDYSVWGWSLVKEHAHLQHE